MNSILILSLVTVVFGQKCGVPPSNYILRGENATKSEFAWQISLQMMISGEWQHRCGGSIIDKQWILTAAHCVDPTVSADGSLRIVVGEYNLKVDEGTESYFYLSRSRDIFIHPGWNHLRLDYDYALIKLPEPLDFDKKHAHITSICLPDRSDFSKFDNMSCTATGWGVTEKTIDQLVPSEILQKINLRIPPYKECGKVWFNVALSDKVIVNLTPRHICGASEQGEGFGVCFGDSGGPLQCKMEDGSWTLVGSTSFGKYCGSNEFPNIFARTSQALLWINLVKSRDNH